jgi:phage terminase Nu1 subunit (DNA packaging protein)
MLLNQKLIAEHLDLSQPAVSGLMDRLGIDWKTSDLQIIRTAYIRYLRTQAAGRGSGEIADERLGLTKAKRIAAEIANRERCGELVEAAPVRQAITTWAAMARNAFLVIPDKLAERCAAESQVDAIHEFLTVEIELVLTDLATGAKAIQFSRNEDMRADG